MSYGDPDPVEEGAEKPDEHADPEEQAVEATEETGEVNPSGAWPDGDPDTRTPA